MEIPYHDERCLTEGVAQFQGRTPDQLLQLLESYGASAYPLSLHTAKDRLVRPRCTENDRLREARKAARDTDLTLVLLSLTMCQTVLIASNEETVQQCTRQYSPLDEPKHALYRRSASCWTSGSASFTLHTYLRVTAAEDGCRLREGVFTTIYRDN
jgi:hypothetical protein